MRVIRNTRYFSKRLGELCEGCKRCIKGEKLVLFVTGLCHRRCWYCPLSEKKKLKDVVFANERKIVKEKDIIEEAKLCEATGAGITGGDPLVTLERTIRYIKLLKEEFGSDFHIHLYTSFNLADEEKLRILYESGLDEIRFHANLYNDKLWSKIEIARKFNWKVGIEVPVIPKLEESLKSMLDFFNNKVDFINLNQLEISDTNAEEVLKRGFEPVNDESSAVRGSWNLGKKLLLYSFAKKHCFSIHLCSSKLKDCIQMKNRILKRAKNVALDFDKITNEGLLLRGVIYGEKTTIEKYIKNKKVKYYIDTKKNRIIVPIEFIKNNHNEIKKVGKPAIVEEYPTEDSLEVTIEYL